jgi:uncharacterized protein YdeI (YjbR/CyaY-like superfamily)
METIHFFKTQSDLRAWFRKNHKTLTEAWIGFYKKDSEKPSITWPESVDEALCVGWIDGLRKSIDEHSYKIRFTPRRKNSIWSRVNLKKVEELTKKKMMRPAGLKIFEERNIEKVNRYSFERDNHTLDPNSEKKFKGAKKAWDFFHTMPPSYRKPALWWVISAKQESTREKRLAILIECSKNQEKIPNLWRSK